MALKIELQANHAATTWTDITGLIDITSIRAGGRAANGESEQLGFNLEDDAAAIELPAHRVVRFTEDATTDPTVIGWGRIQSVDIGRGKLFDGDARQFDVQLTDVNGELRGISFDHVSRPAERPYERMRGVLQTFCDGTWRPSTALNRTALVPLMAFDDMPKNRYPTGKLEDILEDIAQTHNLLYFVTNQRQVFLNSQTTTSYASTIAISDDGDDDGEAIFAPEWEGPANSRDGDQVSSGIRMQYGDGKSVYLRRSPVESTYDRWEDVQSLDTPHKGFATNRANTTLDRHGVEESTIRCALTLRADQVDLIKHGQTLPFRAAAAGILSPLTFRIASLVWEFAGPGIYRAKLELNFPRKVAGSIDHTPAPPPLPPFDPSGAGEFHFVEAADSGIDTLAPPSATLGGADEGDLLVAVLLAETTGGPVVPTDFTANFPDGWALEVGPVGVPAVTDNRLVAIWIAWKIAGDSEPLTVEPVIIVGASINEPGFLCVARYTTDGGVPTVAATDQGSYTAASGTADLPEFTPPARSADLIVAAVGLQPNYVPTASAGWNVRGTPGTGGNRQRIALVDQLIPNADGTSYPGTMNSPGGTDDWWFIPGALFTLERGIPGKGQPVTHEGATSDGSRTLYQAEFPYAPGSLVVEVDNSRVPVIETDPANGYFTLLTPAPPGARVTWRYIAAGQDPTGASNPAPPPTPPVTPPSTPIGVYTPAEEPDGSRTVFTIVPYVAGQATQLMIGTRTEIKDVFWHELDPAGGTVEVGEAPLEHEIIRIWALPLVAVPPSPPPSSGGVTRPLYGAGINADSKANIQGGPEGKIAHTFVAQTDADLETVGFQARGGAVYSGGDGGSYDIGLFATDSAGRPTGSALATATWTPGNPGTWTTYPVVTWSSPFTTTKGTRYAVVFENTDAMPLVNYVSINELFMFSNSPIPGGQGRQPLFNDNDYAVWVNTGSGWVVKSRFTADMDLTYSDGHHDGMAYIQNMETTTYSGGTHVPGIVNGPDHMVREHIAAVTGGDRRLIDIHIRGRRNNDGTDPLVVQLKQGATVVGTVAIPASTFPKSAPYNDDGGSAWGAAAWSATLAIEGAAAYDIEFSTGPGTTYSLAPIRKGTIEGFDASLVFMDGVAEFTTDGGANWDPCYPFDADPPGLQWYARVAT